jgi:DNA-binding response OmpR family regulator
MDLLNKVEHALSFRTTDPNQKTRGSADQIWPDGLEPDPLRNPGLKWKNKSVNLSITQLRLVKRLVQNAGTVVEYKDLEKQLVSTNSKKAIATHLTAVRQRFRDVDPDFDQIDNDPGKGYVWKASD